MKTRSSIFALAATALVLTPSVVAGRRLPLFVSFWSSTARPLAPAEVALAWLAGTVILVLIAHYLRTFALARSPWRVLDLLGLMVVLVAIRAITASLLRGMAWAALGWALLAVGIGLVVALAVGFALITLLTRLFTGEAHWWALIVAGVLALVGSGIVIVEMPNGGMLQQVVEAAFTASQYLWPLVLVGLGLWIIFKKKSVEA